MIHAIRDWVLDRPSRALGALSVVVLVGVLVAGTVVFNFQQNTYERKVAAAQREASAAASATATPTPSRTLHLPFQPRLPTSGGIARAEDGPSAPPAEPVEDLEATAAAHAAADAFARAWLAGAQATDTQTWAATVAPLVIPDLAEVLPLTETSAIPTSPLAAVAVDELAPEAAVAHLELQDGTRVRIDLAPQPGGWLVTDYNPAP